MPSSLFAKRCIGLLAAHAGLVSLVGSFGHQRAPTDARRGLCSARAAPPGSWCRRPSSRNAVLDCSLRMRGVFRSIAPSVTSGRLLSARRGLCSARAAPLEAGAVILSRNAVLDFSLRLPGRVSLIAPSVTSGRLLTLAEDCALLARRPWKLVPSSLFAKRCIGLLAALAGRASLVAPSVTSGRLLTLAEDCALLRAAPLEAGAVVPLRETLYWIARCACGACSLVAPWVASGRLLTLAEDCALLARRPWKLVPSSLFAKRCIGLLAALAGLVSRGLNVNLSYSNAIYDC